MKPSLMRPKRPARKRFCTGRLVPRRYLARVGLGVRRVTERSTASMSSPVTGRRSTRKPSAAGARSGLATTHTGKAGRMSRVTCEGL
jgi:hypothetical protein